MTAGVRGAAWPAPADFPSAPTPADRERWTDADAAARPRRLERLRQRLVDGGYDAFFGLRPESSRYLTGFALGDGEDRVAGTSGWFLVSADEVVLFADTRYEIQARREARGARIANVYNDLPTQWPGLCRSVGARRVAVEAAAITKATWDRLETAGSGGRSGGIELVAVDGWVESERATKEPAEVERIAAACAIADRALATLLPEIRPGTTERELALRLEWLVRTGGADGLAFDVACLAGQEAALPHGSPGDREVRTGAVLLFDFGARVDGYRSDMTRTLFVGDPSDRELALYELVARSQGAAMDAVTAAVQGDARPLPTGRAIDAVARGVIEAAGYGERFGHGTGHGIGLATHEEPRLSRTAPEGVTLPSRTVFSIEPGIYIEGETGIRIEDLVQIDADAHATRVLTGFPRDVLVVGS